MLLTGGTGFLGEYLVAELLQRGHSVWALYRSEARRLDTVRFLCQQGLIWKAQSLMWIKGNVLDAPNQWERWCESYPGLDEADALIHAAASTRLLPNLQGDPRRTNVGSAQALLSLTKLKPLNVHIISTAYVCGLVQGKMVCETNHPNTNFVNAYEASKWEAEQLWMGRATILRPSIIVGDYQSGRCRSFGGWYLLVRAAKLHDVILRSNNGHDRTNLRMKLPADPDGSLNLVPVDYVAQAAVRIIEEPDNQGNIFHLTHPNPVNHQEDLDTICKRFNLGGIELVGRGSSIPEPDNDVERLTFRQMEAILPHFANNPSFDRHNVERALPDLKPPPVDESFLNRLIDYAVESDWGENGRMPCNLAIVP